MLRNIHRLLYSFWCLECWKWHFRASRFKNFLGGGTCPQTPLEDGALRSLNCNSRLLLYYHPPTSNFIENPDMCKKTFTLHGWMQMVVDKDRAVSIGQCQSRNTYITSCRLSQSIKLRAAWKVINKLVNFRYPLYSFEYIGIIFHYFVAKCLDT